MQRYTRIFLITLASIMLAFAGFNLLVDPYATTGAPDLPGLTERDTRRLDDGGRVHVADRLARGGDHSILLGSSRTVDGFPHDPDNWPGGIFNAGMRGTNMFELVQAMMLAGQNPELRCVVVGLDLDEFGTHSKTKPSYWLSALTDSRRDFATARVALSPNTFASSLQLLSDNLTGSAPRVPWADQYEVGWQRDRYARGTTGSYRFYLGYTYDAARLGYLETALATLTGRGVQVIGFFHPLHAWREEALFRSGRAEDYFELQRSLTNLFDTYSDAYSRSGPTSGCLEGGSAVLWDFSGFRAFATRSAPQPDATDAHPTFYEPAHYLPHVGQALLDAMTSDTSDAVNLGQRLTPETVDAAIEATRSRRDAWLDTPDGRAVTDLLDAYIDTRPVAEAAPPIFLNRDDWQTLERKRRRIAQARTDG